jgi:hypothetical protein
MSRERHIETYPVEIRDYSDYYSHSTSGVYLEVPLPDEIVDMLDKEPEEYFGDGGKSLYMSLASSDPGCLRVDLENTNTRHELSLKYYKDRDPSYAVSIPAQFVEHDDRSPFFEASPGFDGIVEVDYRASCFRIYSEGGYKMRLGELVNQGDIPKLKGPAALALGTSEFGYAGLGPDMDFFGRFRIRPFVGITDEIIEYVVGRTDHWNEIEDYQKHPSRARFELSIDIVGRVMNECEIFCPNVKIMALNNASVLNRNDSEVIVAEKFEPDQIHSRGVLLDIPKVGAYQICVNSRFGNSNVLVSWDDGWRISYGGVTREVDSSLDDVFDLYVPVPLNTENPTTNQQELISEGLLEEEVSVAWKV